MRNEWTSCTCPACGDKAEYNRVDCWIYCQRCGKQEIAGKSISVEERIAVALERIAAAVERR